MRLIDADAFLERTKKDPLFPLVERYGLSGVIENEPTVEAIPIDWLKKKYFNKRTIYSDRSLARQMAVKELIKEWEDESKNL